MKEMNLLNLTKSDLLENPIWEYRIEGNTELVRSVNLNEIRGDANTVYIVATVFQLNNKSKYIGYCSPQHPGSMENLQPVMLVREEHFPLYKNTEWKEDEKHAFIHRIGLETGDIFPILFRTRAKCDNDYFEGVVAGFDPESL